MARTDKDRTLPTISKTDRAHMRAERKRQRRRDRHHIRAAFRANGWDDYTHPRHPFDRYGLPSW